MNPFQIHFSDSGQSYGPGPGPDPGPGPGPGPGSGPAPGPGPGPLDLDLGVRYYTLLGIPSWRRDSMNSSSSKDVSQWLIIC